MKDQNFLDKSTLFSILLLGCCWIAWDMYMKKKYPQKTTPPQATQTQQSQPEIQPLEQASPRGDLPPQKLLSFSGDNMRIVFSSWGFGIQEAQLKNHFDREQKTIFFRGGEQPLFATKKLGESSPLSFVISQKEPHIFEGHYLSENFEVIKTIVVEEQAFSLKIHTQIQHKREPLPGMTIVFSQDLPEETEEEGFLDWFNIYGKDIFKGFFVSDKDQQIFTTEVPEPQANTQVVALGGKYFGQAFINEAELLPQATFSLTKKQAQARLDYKFLHSKPITLKSTVFLGPKTFKNLAPLKDQAKEWVDFGFFSWLARPLLFILRALHQITHNWGFAIILLTLLVRILLLPVNVKSYKSMKTMQKIQPQIKELREKHKEDPQKLNTEVMKLMKENNTNPLGGCLPLFFQFPVFFALYRVLGESAELYQAPFVFWVQDLSLKDPYFVLPILGGLTLFVQQKLTPMNMPKAQQRILVFMPIVFSVFMLGLPSGLTLYIFVSGLFGLAQHQFFAQFRIN